MSGAQRANEASSIAYNLPNQARAETAPVVENAQNQQQKLQGQADTSLQFGQGLAQPAAETYKNFAATGGFSPSDETTYLNRATQGVAGTYDVLGKAAERQRAATGGMGTGGEFSQMARQGAQQQALATENAQAGLHQQENANKLAGAGGLGSLYGQTNQLWDAQTGAATAQGKQILDALGLRYNTDAEAAAILAQLSKDPSNITKILGDIKGIAGVTSGVLGAIP